MSLQDGERKTWIIKRLRKCTHRAAQLNIYQVLDKKRKKKYISRQESKREKNQDWAHGYDNINVHRVYRNLLACNAGDNRVYLANARVYSAHA